MDSPKTGIEWAIFAWSILGLTALLANPIARLVPPVLEAFSIGLDPIHWVVGGAWLVFMLYAEGYRGFHLKFSPRVVVRAVALSKHRPILPLLFAPFACTGLLWATRKRKIVSWCLVIGISLIVIVVRSFPPVWRGVIDLGVIAGLSTGLASVYFHAFRVLRGHVPQMPADLPDTV